MCVERLSSVNKVFLYLHNCIHPVPQTKYFITVFHIYLCFKCLENTSWCNHIGGCYIILIVDDVQLIKIYLYYRLLIKRFEKFNYGLRIYIYKYGFAKWFSSYCIHIILNNFLILCCFFNACGTSYIIILITKSCVLRMFTKFMER